MKKTVLAMIAALTMSAAAMAQDSIPSRNVRQRTMPNRTEMAQRRTQQMVEQLGLDTLQARQLLELNTRYADQMQPMGPRGDRQPGARRQGAPQSGSLKPGAPHPKARRGGPRGGNGAQDADSLRAPRPDDRRQAMQAYDAELKQLLTEEQYQTYKAAEQQRMQQRQGRGGRQQGQGRGGQQRQRSDE